MKCFLFFFQAEDGIRDLYVTGVQTCALPISPHGPREPASFGRSRGAERLAEKRSDPLRSADGELAPRAHLRIVLRLDLAAQGDAGRLLGADDPALERIPVCRVRDEARLLVRDPPRRHSLPQPRKRVEPALEPDALLYRPRRHPEPLLALCRRRRTSCRARGPARGAASAYTERRRSPQPLPAICRSTYGRIPPWRKYSTSTGVSMRSVSGTRSSRPSFLCTTSVTSCRGASVPPAPARS